MAKKSIKKETIDDSSDIGDRYSYISALRKEYNDAQKILADNNSTNSLLLTFISFDNS